MADLTRVLDETIRAERGRILAGLLRHRRDLDAAEDALQEAVLSAMEAWRVRIPDNPGAWLTRAAMNRARDAFRHEAIALRHAVVEEPESDEPLDTLHDDHLRLIFMCCHPALSTENQIALTLKVVLGFSTEEIARAFLSTEDTVSQRIVRARRALSDLGEPSEAPDARELEERVTAAHGVVYAIFNEGHTAQSGALMRVDLQAEALRLGRLLGDLLPRDPETFGLLSLMAFSAARAHTRVDAEGAPVLLPAQDRSQWNRPLIREALMSLQYARSLGPPGPYVLQAEIASAHVTSPAWEATDFHAIVVLYDRLLEVTRSPIVALNRAIALAERDGPAAGLVALQPLEGPLSRYALFHATRAELLSRSGGDARAELTRALSLTANDGERLLLSRRLERLP